MSPVFTKMKGSLMVAFVKNLKAAKDEKLEAYLTEADHQVLRERILSSVWYPGETARHIIQGLYEVLGQGHSENARQWGKIAAYSVASDTYRNFIHPGSPFETFRDFQKIFMTFADFRGFKAVEAKPDYSESYLLDPGDDPIFVPMAYMLAGWIEGLIEISQGKNIEFTITRETREEKNAYVYRARQTKP